tara:strand:+ start:1574 stop:1741 length:168 start_codon:yes stop_codon:yes gene_type:complete
LTNDISDIVKAAGAGGGGVGVHYVEISQLLQICISIACLVYLITKIVFLIKNKGK